MKFKHLAIAILLLIAGQGFSQTDSTQAQADTILPILQDLPTPGAQLPNFVKVHVIKGTNRHRNPYDGDGAKVLFPDGRVVKVRFPNYDAPEIKNLSWYAGVDTMQPFAVESRDYLAALINGKDILLDTLPFGGTKARKSYDRMVADPYSLDSSLVTFDLIRAGCGWYAAGDLKRANPSITSVLQSAFEAAKAGKKGLWGLRGKKFSPAYWKKTFRNNAKQ